jgi:hypothetical protein
MEQGASVTGMKTKRILTQRRLFAIGLLIFETTDLSCHLLLKTFAPTRERRPQYRGARAEVIGKISDMAN